MKYRKSGMPDEEMWKLYLKSNVPFDKEWVVGLLPQKAQNRRQDIYQK